MREGDVFQCLYTCIYSIIVGGGGGDHPAGTCTCLLIYDLIFVFFFNKEKKILPCTFMGMFYIYLSIYIVVVVAGKKARLCTFKLAHVSFFFLLILFNK